MEEGSRQKNSVSVELTLTPSVRSISNRGLYLFTSCVKKRSNVQFALEYVVRAQRGSEVQFCS